MNERRSPLVLYSSGRASRLPDLILLFALLAGALFFLIRTSSLPQYDWNWPLLLDFIVIKNASGEWEAGLLIRGLFMTLRIGFWTIVLSFLCGAPLGAVAARARPATRLIIHSYINIIRDIPPLVLLFCVYFFAGNILPVAAINSFLQALPAPLPDFVNLTFAPPAQMDRMLSAVLALGLYQGAFVAEIIRTGIESVPSGQWDAALALGFPPRRALVQVIFPQAARLIIPPMTGQAIATIKDSALASMISLPELTFQSLEAMSVSQLTFEIWIVCALLYLILGLACAWAGKFLEKRRASFE